MLEIKSNLTVASLRAMSNIALTLEAKKAIRKSKNLAVTRTREQSGGDDRGSDRVRQRLREVIHLDMSVD